MKPLAPALFGLALWAMPVITSAQEPLIAAASVLKFALDDIATTYEAQTGQALRIAYGSTGNFSAQIREGAPFDLFLAADEAFILGLAEDGLTRDDGVIYASGRLAMLTPKNGSLAASADLSTLAAALQRGDLGRFAIASPVHAPYGMRAQEALEHQGLWVDIQDHLVFGENVSQATQFAISGNTDGGIVAYALALAPEVHAQSDFALIPADWHAPLHQRMALLPDASAEAEAFYTFLQSDAARAVFASYGFAVPEAE